ncbi:MAG: hypothetical protein ACRDL7_05470, partial [Gaiellaceae bacterium]
MPANRPGIPPGPERAGSARRSPPERVEPDPRLTAVGWEGRFVAQGTRCEEMEGLYRELGFEVLAVPIAQNQLSDECEECRLAAMLEFKLIYVRRAGPGRAAAPP